MSDDNVLITLLEVAREVTEDIIPPMSDALFGLDTELFFPISTDSIYGDSDRKFTYMNIPDRRGRYIFVGIFSERFMSDSTVDNYGEESYMITVASEVIPRNSKVIAYLKEQQVFTFRVYDIRVVPGRNNPVYKKLMLAPHEIRV